MATFVERDWIQELEERKVITSAEMQCFVQRMGAETMFNAPDLAAVLATSVNTVYALVDQGAIGYIDRDGAMKIAEGTLAMANEYAEVLSGGK